MVVNKLTVFCPINRGTAVLRNGNIIAGCPEINYNDLSVTL